MHYKIYVKNPSSHYLYIDLTISNVATEELGIQLASWRPGRYELGNFAKNIKKFDAFNEKGELLLWSKKSKDLWVVQTGGSKSIKVTYSYYSADLNAGSTYVDEEQVYLNPVNCCMYVPEKMNEEHVLELELPENYSIAASLKPDGKNRLKADNYEQLADSPFFASAHIQTLCIPVKGINFYLHFNGECILNESKITADFSRFIEDTLNYFGTCPFTEYHFLYQVLTHKFYHGVEHCNSTMIAIGPGYNLMHGDTYLDFIGVSCHELYHAWNIKTIRPAEMHPYDYTRENYARTGFVYEGVTTYYGDKLLFTSDVFSEKEYFVTLEERLNKHFHNYGRFNLSVADSSWDNWLDGYAPGTPYRKVSIYDEGNLVAFMLDVLIMKQTGNTKSLRDVMRMLYNDFYLKGKGYTENDINSLVHFAAGTSFDDFFTKYVYGLEDYNNQLQECFNYIGLKIERHPAEKFFERYMGFKAVEHGHHKKVTLVAPYSPAWKAHLAINDEIIGVNGYQLKNDMNHWIHYFDHGGKPVELNVLSNGRLKNILVNYTRSHEYFPVCTIVHLADATAAQKNNFKAWKAKS